MPFTQRNQWVTVDVSSLGYSLLQGLLGTLPVYAADDKGPLPEVLMVAIENLLVTQGHVPSNVPRRVRRRLWRFDPVAGVVQVSKPVP